MITNCPYCGNEIWWFESGFEWKDDFHGVMGCDDCL